MRKITELVVHTSATPPQMDIGRKEINQWHKEKGWSGIGYHYVIRRSGTIEKGRADSRVGAHVAYHNRNSLGICLVGGINSRTRKPEKNYTPAQMRTLKTLLTKLSRRHRGAVVLGHRDFKGVAKACPCFDAIPWARKNGLPVPKRIRGRQAFREIKTSRTIPGVVLASAGGSLTAVGDTLGEQFNLPWWVLLVGALFTVAGLGLVLYSRLTDAQTNPKFIGDAPDDDSKEEPVKWDLP